jgi:two-component system, NtrC family, sensor kinase
MTTSVLIVDDSLTVRMNLQEVLDEAGFRTTAAASLAEARQRLDGDRFALVILDVLLPDGDGVTLLEEIRAAAWAARTAVVMLSSEAEIRDRVRGLTRGADDYVGKPYDPSYLVARARQLVRDYGASRVSETPTILVIDDSITFRESLKEALLEAGFDVLSAATGEDGLKLAADRRPAALIVDGMLPGIDGATVIRRARLDAVLRRVPCLLLTASEEGGGAEIAALEAGADAFVRKEEDIAVILARLRAMLRSAGSEEPSLSPASLLGPKKILAVDDSETHLQALADALRADGYEVALARTGEEALELLALQPVDCLLLDLMMPGIGGLETCQRVKSNPAMRDVPTIMLTAMEGRASMIEGLSAGADDYVAKSSEFDVIRARVLAQLRRRQFEDENRLMREQLLRTELDAAEARANRELAETRAALVEELKWKNEELEAFSYSVAHDLRAPLRALDGFSQALIEDYQDKLDLEGRQYLDYIRESAQHMAQLIDDLLMLSRVTRMEFERDTVDLSGIARGVAARLARAQPERVVEMIIPDELLAEGDERLLTILMENLLGNAWKFSGRRSAARIELGLLPDRAFFVQDNGAGFDMAYASKLFGVFQRLHTSAEFEGTGIGLATVQRIIRRHGGRIWAEGAIDQGATFFFTLQEGPPRRREAEL